MFSEAFQFLHFQHKKPITPKTPMHVWACGFCMPEKQQFLHYVNATLLDNHTPKHYCRNMLKCKLLKLLFCSISWLLEFARVLSAMWDKHMSKERTFLIYGVFTGERKILFLLINSVKFLTTCPS